MDLGQWPQGVLRQTASLAIGTTAWCGLGLALQGGQRCLAGRGQACGMSAQAHQHAAAPRALPSA